MADRTVLIAGKPQHHPAVKAEQIAGEKPIRDQNARPLEMQPPARAAVQNIHDPAADITDIDTALPDILIVHIFQPVCKDLLCPLNGGGTARTGGDIIADLVGEGFILQQGDLKQQNIRIGALGALAKPAQLVLGQHNGHIIESALPERVADDAVQPCGAVVDLLDRADHNTGRSRHAGVGVHRVGLLFESP